MDKGAAFTDRVHFLPLQDEAAWANTIAGASLRRDPDARRKAVEAGYDIHHSAEILQEFYLRRYRRCCATIWPPGMRGLPSSTSPSAG